MNKFDKENAEIGMRIHEIRVKRKMTQEELAEKANICNPQQMSNIERGLSGVSVARLKDLCSVLDVEADYLLFGTSVRNADSFLQKYIRKMDKNQIEDLAEIVRIYARACGIKEE